MGYAGMKFLSETMTWTRAPADLKKCGDDVARAPEPIPGPAPDPVPEKEKTADPAPVPAPAPDETQPDRSDKTARGGKKKDCKMDLGFAVVTFPCGD